MQEFDEELFELEMAAMGFKQRKSDKSFYKKVDYYCDGKSWVYKGFNKLEIGIYYAKRKKGLFYIQASIEGITPNLIMYTGKFNYYDSFDDKFDKQMFKIFKIVAEISKPVKRQ